MIGNTSSASAAAVAYFGAAKAVNHDFQIALELLPNIENAAATQLEPCYLEERTLQCFNLFYVISGTGQISINHVPQYLNPGNVYIWKPGETWSARLDTPLHALSVKFDWPGRLTGDQARSEVIQLPTRFPLKAEGQEGIKEIFDLLIDCCLSKQRYWKLSSAGYLYALLAALQREVGAGLSDKPALDRRLTLALSFMEEHLSETISVRDIAEYSNLTEDYFRRLFTRRMKMSPVKYLTMLRMREARRLMTVRPEMTIYATGRQVGYSDGRYFARMFRRHLGVTPGAYRAAVCGPA